MKTKQTKPKGTYGKLLESYRANQAMLMRMMSLKDEDMFTLILGYGMEYLQEQCRGDKAGIDILSAESFYWNWWKQNWHQRDAEFIALHGLQNGEDTERDYEFSVNEDGELTTMTLYGAYRLYHLEAMHSRHLCNSYYHVISATQSVWRKEVFNH